jgi:hypothetical protein
MCENWLPEHSSSFGLSYILLVQLQWEYLDEKEKLDEEKVNL